MVKTRAFPSLAALALAGLMTVAAAPGLRAQTATDPADLAYWQSVQSSTDPAEYQSYLETFPNGRFVALARARLARLQGGGGGATPGGGGAAPPIAIPGMTTATRPAPAPAPAPVPAPQPPDPPADEVEEKITLSPAAPRVGQIITFTCVGFPDPTSYDMVVVVPAGTPEMAPTRDPQETKIVAREYAVNCKQNGSWKGGPLAPGRYEVRFVTMLYNNEHRYEVRTRTPFSVR